MLDKRPYLFSYLLSDPGNCRRAAINITLPHLQGFALFLLDVNDVYTCACGSRPPLWTTAITHDDAGPQAGMQLAGRTSQHLVGVGWAMALKSPAACSDLLLGRSRFFSPAPLPPPKNSILQAECRLNQSWHAECPWVGWRSHCRCVCVCSCCGSLVAVGDAFCIKNSIVKGQINKCLCEISNQVSWLVQKYISQAINKSSNDKDVMHMSLLCVSVYNPCLYVNMYANVFTSASLISINVWTSLSCCLHNYFWFVCVFLSICLSVTQARCTTENTVRLGHLLTSACVSLTFTSIHKDFLSCSVSPSYQFNLIITYKWNSVVVKLCFTSSNVHQKCNIYGTFVLSSLDLHEFLVYCKQQMHLALSQVMALASDKGVISYVSDIHTLEMRFLPWSG